MLEAIRRYRALEDALESLAELYLGGPGLYRKVWLDRRSIGQIIANQLPALLRRQGFDPEEVISHVRRKSTEIRHTIRIVNNELEVEGCWVKLGDILEAAAETIK